jgi:hypothetical protein
MECVLDPKTMMTPDRGYKLVAILSRTGIKYETLNLAEDSTAQTAVPSGEYINSVLFDENVSVEIDRRRVPIVGSMITAGFVANEIWLRSLLTDHNPSMRDGHLSEIGNEDDGSPTNKMYLSGFDTWCDGKERIYRPILVPEVDLDGRCYTGCDLIVLLGVEAGYAIVDVDGKERYDVNLDKYMDMVMFTTTSTIQIPTSPSEDTHRTIGIDGSSTVKRTFDAICDLYSRKLGLCTEDEISMAKDLLEDDYDDDSPLIDAMGGEVWFRAFYEDDDVCGKYHLSVRLS